MTHAFNRRHEAAANRPRKALLLTALAACGALAFGGAAGAEPWPSRPIMLTVVGPPGSAPDAAARELVARIGLALGQPIVIENMAGAGWHHRHAEGAQCGARRLSLPVHPQRRRRHQPGSLQDAVLRPGRRLRPGVPGADRADDTGGIGVAGGRSPRPAARAGQAPARRDHVRVRRCRHRRLTCSWNSSRPPRRCPSTTCRSRARTGWAGLDGRTGRRRHGIRHGADAADRVRQGAGAWR